MRGFLIGLLIILTCFSCKTTQSSSSNQSTVGDSPYGIYNGSDRNGNDCSIEIARHGSDDFSVVVNIAPDGKSTALFGHFDRNPLTSQSIYSKIIAMRDAQSGDSQIIRIKLTSDRGPVESYEYFKGHGKNSDADNYCNITQNPEEISTSEYSPYGTFVGTDRDGKDCSINIAKRGAHDFSVVVNVAPDGESRSIFGHFERDDLTSQSIYSKIVAMHDTQSGDSQVIKIKLSSNKGPVESYEYFKGHGTSNTAENYCTIGSP